MRLRRTMFWVNGPDFTNLEEVINSNTDAVQLDLEQHVNGPDKIRARDNLCRILKEVDFKGKEKVVRINHPDTQLGIDDLAAVLPCMPDAVRIPKTERVETVLKVDRIITDFEKKNGLPHNTIEILLLLETPIGINNGYRLDTCCDRVTGVGLGAGDLTTCMHVRRSMRMGNMQLVYAKQKMVLDAKAAGIGVADTVVGCSKDFGPEAVMEFVRADTELDKEMGFTGRSVGMLEHVDMINEILSPSAQEIEDAEAVVKAYERQQAEGREDVYLNGKWVDPDVYLSSKYIAEIGAAIRKKKSYKG
ncbi:CoA ester lyase [Lacrimispora sp. NSJ-141]|uniref:CoA ester lyase n=1 Tax=Lientehia hominis TaxID=2897778 RepID=A0AAP2RHP5_9FIRM|nr:CoA ester lyase [Lientehia hominis]MCD2492172.1 CoA ester lyase [Lientehia hominis]